ncbi:histidine kinase N-terminal 7TM domain-containing protein [Halococcus salifodinae]|uniref:histidine kinase N-terminal 7TM domain-containing protein n=1 Tax=Halococcus salifodinae TaxID=36738 RepID=UPI0009B5BA5B|nr:histidine kinase N-terminal 7TM domain-containing protein [Halococcus salifodinae]
MTLLAVVYVALLALSAAITGGLAVYAWRRQDEPGAVPFAGLMAATSVWTVCAAATLLTRDPEVHLLIEQGQWAATVFVPVFWVLFALTYTGHDELVSGRTVLLLSIVPVVSLALGLTNPLHGLVWTDTRVYVASGVAIATRLPGDWYWVFVVYAYALIGTGTLLILRLVFVSDYLFTDQAVLLVVGTIVPLVGNAVSVTEVTPLPGIDVTPFAFTVTGITFGYALFRRRLFELVPATRRLGRDTAIATLDDSILILDSNYHVIYVNPEAADVLDCNPREVLSAPAANLIDTSVIEFDVPDALAELHIDGRFYEARSSTITDRRDREIGHTLVLHDITVRKRREHRLRQQRDELAQLDHLNEAIHDSTQAFVSATSRNAIETVVCDRLTASDLYTEASIVVDPTDEIVASDGGEKIEGADTPIVIPTMGSTEEAVSSVSETLPDVLDTEHGSWAVVPLRYGQSIYGTLVLYTTRSDAFESRELTVLGQFGDTISQAINAVENQRLLLADTVTELTFRCPDAALAEVTRKAGCRLSLKGLVPTSDSEMLLYYHAMDGSAQHAVDTASGIDGIDGTRVVDDADDMVEFTLTDRSALLALSEGGANVRTAEADEGEYRVVAEVAPKKDIRALTEHIREYCPRATLAAKRDLDRPVETDQQDALPDDTLDELTDRQREVLEAAYRAGYFRWPRDRTAEEVAESITVSSPTLHKHLRRAEEQLLDSLFDQNDDTDRPRKRESE